MFPQFDTAARRARARHRHGRLPGAAVGAAVFDAATAIELQRPARRILVRRETSPDDLPRHHRRAGVLTSRGGKTSHAAVVARGMGKTCVVGADDLQSTRSKQFTTPGGTVVREGDIVSIDGANGAVYAGAIPVAPTPVVEYFEGRLTREQRHADPVVHAVARMMAYADERRHLGVHANADTPADAARARRFGADGIGLCRTEHMFLGERRRLVERLVTADTEDERDSALAELLPLQLGDFTGLFAAMDTLPVTIRLLDPPLHEFLPDLTELSVKVALAEARGESDETDVRLLAAVRRLHEQNPMLGLRGVRLGLVVPGLVAVQVRAIALAATARIKAGSDPRPEIMVPLIGGVEEFDLMHAEIRRVLDEVAAETGVVVDAAIGTMIELPRAALTAGRIAERAAFFSFGTNDLTQTTWGFSRDDVEGSFFPRYFAKASSPTRPFESLDGEGVGRLVEIARRARAGPPNPT